LQRARFEGEEAALQAQIKQLDTARDDNWEALRALQAQKNEIHARIQMVKQYLDRLSRKERVHVEEVH
jgi:chromosome segregation ATPase